MCFISNSRIIRFQNNHSCQSIIWAQEQANLVVHTDIFGKRSEPAYSRLNEGHTYTAGITTHSEMSRKRGEQVNLTQDRKLFIYNPTKEKEKMKETPYITATHIYDARYRNT